MVKMIKMIKARAWPAITKLYWSFVQLANL